MRRHGIHKNEEDVAMERRMEIIEIGGELRARLAERGDETLTLEWLVERELERYYALLDRDRGEARVLLSADELGLIVDASNGALHSNPYTVFVLHHAIADAVGLDDLDLKWGVDGRPLVEKLEGMSPAALVAVVVAAERYWAGADAEGWSKFLD